MVDTKGRRLIEYLEARYPILDTVDLPDRDRKILFIIKNMSDERFDSITNPTKFQLDIERSIDEFEHIFLALDEYDKQYRGNVPEKEAKRLGLI